MVAAQKLKEVKITEQDSLLLTKDQLRIAISPEKYFNDKSVPALEMKIKKLMPIAELQRFFNWMEKGVCDSLQKKYLKTLLFCICEAVDGPMIEEYAFSFSYSNSDSQEVLMNINRTGNKEQGTTFKSNTTTDIAPNQMRSSMVTTLIQLMQSLDQMPEGRTILMKLLYCDDVTPVDFEPPFFRCCSEQEANNPWMNKPLKMEDGNVNSKHFVLALKVSHSTKDDQYIVAPAGKKRPHEDNNMADREDDTQDAEEDEHQWTRVREVDSRHIDTVELTDVLSNFPDISVVLLLKNDFKDSAQLLLRYRANTKIHHLRIMGGEKTELCKNFKILGGLLSGAKSYLEDGEGKLLGSSNSKYGSFMASFPISGQDKREVFVGSTPPSVDSAGIQSPYIVICGKRVEIKGAVPKHILETISPESTPQSSETNNDVRKVVSSRKGTTLVVMRLQDTMFLAADGATSVDGVIDNEEECKLHQMGHSLVCAIGGNMYEAERVVRHMIKVVEGYEIVDEDGSFLRTLTVMEVAEFSYNYMKYKKLDKNYFAIIFVGFDLGQPRIAILTTNGFEDFSNSDYICISGSVKAESLAYALLGAEHNPDMGLKSAATLVKEAIYKASQSDDLTGGKISVCYVKEQKLKFLEREWIEQVGMKREEKERRAQQ